MLPHSFFRVIAFALALAVGLGLFGQGSHVDTMTDNMTAVANIDMPHSMNCHICCNEADVCFDACYAVSICSLAIVPINVAISYFGVAKFDALTRDVRTDRTSATDPHPPKRLLQT